MPSRQHLRLLQTGISSAQGRHKHYLFGLVMRGRPLYPCRLLPCSPPMRKYMCLKQNFRLSEQVGGLRKIHVDGGEYNFIGTVRNFIRCVFGDVFAVIEWEVEVNRITFKCLDTVVWRSHIDA